MYRAWSEHLVHPALWRNFLPFPICKRGNKAQEVGDDRKASLRKWYSAWSLKDELDVK